MAAEISEGRRKAYHAGMGLIIPGGILFASAFVTFALLVDGGS